MVVAALDYVGGFSSPGKMPCHGYSIPAAKCLTGGKLRKQENTVCSKCYAFWGNYPFPAVQKAMARRFESLTKPFWVENMVAAIMATESSGFFRWHDSGDLQDEKHLDNIVKVALALPNIRFWLPTKELKIVSDYIESGKSIPFNLTIRLSGYVIDGPAPTKLAQRLGVQTSTVSKKNFDCPASTQGNKCLTCRKCWDSNIENVTYKYH